MNGIVYCITKYCFGKVLKDNSCPFFNVPVGVSKNGTYFMFFSLIENI